MVDNQSLTSDRLKIAVDALIAATSQHKKNRSILKYTYPFDETILSLFLRNPKLFRQDMIQQLATSVVNNSAAPLTHNKSLPLNKFRRDFFGYLINPTPQALIHIWYGMSTIDKMGIYLSFNIKTLVGGFCTSSSSSSTALYLSQSTGYSGSSMTSTTTGGISSSTPVYHPHPSTTMVHHHMHHHMHHHAHPSPSSSLPPTSSSTFSLPSPLPTVSVSGTGTSASPPTSIPPTLTIHGNANQVIITGSTLSGNSTVGMSPSANATSHASNSSVTTAASPQSYGGYLPPSLQ